MRRDGCVGNDLLCWWAWLRVSFSFRCHCQVVSKLSKSLAIAEREYATATAHAAPLEEAYALLTFRLESAVGTTKLGSELQLEDIDALVQREKDQVSNC